MQNNSRRNSSYRNNDRNNRNDRYESNDNNSHQGRPSRHEENDYSASSQSRYSNQSSRGQYRNRDDEGRFESNNRYSSGSIRIGMIMKIMKMKIIAILHALAIVIMDSLAMMKAV